MRKLFATPIETALAKLVPDDTPCCESINASEYHTGNAAANLSTESRI